MTDQDKGQDLKRTVKYLLIFCLVWLAVDIGVALWTHSLQGIEIRTGAGTTRLGSLTALMILPFLWPAARGIRWAIDITLWLLFLFAAFALIAAIELAFRVTLTVGGDRIPQGGIAYFAVWFELLGIGVCSALLAQSLRRNAPPRTAPSIRPKKKDRPPATPWTLLARLLRLQMCLEKGRSQAVFLEANSSGKTISLVQHGTQTARKRNSANRTIAPMLGMGPIAQAMWTNEAAMLSST